MCVCVCFKMTEQYCNIVGELSCGIGERKAKKMGKSVDKNVLLQQLEIIYESKGGIFWA